MTNTIIADSNGIFNELPQARRKHVERLMQALVNSNDHQLRLDANTHLEFDVTASDFRQAVWDLIDADLASAYWDSRNGAVCLACREAI
jgi:hypothetical protein